MPVPSVPTNFFAQQGNGQAYVLCDQMATATGYQVYRSTDNVSFSLLASPSAPEYLDTSVTAGTKYWYTMTATNGSGASAQTASQAVIPVVSGQMTLSQIRLQAQQRADRVNSNFVTLPEWNTYINQSAFELYDLLTTTYEDYYVKTPYVFLSNGNQQYNLPNGTTVTDAISGLVADPFYKLLRVEIGISNGITNWVTLKRFNFQEGNNRLYPLLKATLVNGFGLKYRLVGNTLMFDSFPSSNQYFRVWYYPRMVQLLKESDILDGISGWTDYVIVDAAIRALQKEESDISVLAAEKMAIIDRINGSAVNRDAGQPDTITDIRRSTNDWGMGSGWGEGF